MRQLKSKMSSLSEKLEQRKQELQEAKEKAKYLNASYEMIAQEVTMTAPLVEKGIRSKIDFLKLQREANEIYEKYNTISISMPRLKSSIKEAKNKIKEEALNFKSDAKIKLNEALSELQTLKANSTAFQDQVYRTAVTSPMDGIVQKLFVHTIGGIIKPGADILEIVPSNQALLVEVKIKPADIAFIYFGQKSIVKFSAYDFSIYGGLTGEVVHISADTIKDKKENTFYTVRIKTDKNYIGSIQKKLKIIPGMTVSVDILTGKKSVLDYILKPILKTKQYSLSER
jgi:adhesin transport system membrane fusion protein